MSSTDFDRANFRGEEMVGVEGKEMRFFRLSGRGCVGGNDGALAWWGC
jgi:hypothetical protein